MVSASMRGNRQIFVANVDVGTVDCEKITEVRWARLIISG